MISSAKETLDYDMGFRALFGLCFGAGGSKKKLKKQDEATRDQMDAKQQEDWKKIRNRLRKNCKTTRRMNGAIYIGTYEELYDPVPTVKEAKEQEEKIKRLHERVLVRKELDQHRRHEVEAQQEEDWKKLQARLRRNL